MATTITLILPDQVYEIAKRRAQLQHKALDEMLVNEITKTVFEAETGAELSYEPDESVERERQAYIAMHPYLRQHYLGKHVAIYQGKLVDFDEDYGALYDRIDQQYPDIFVWLDTVGEEAMETLTLRSPLSLED
ncbi:MAG: DUF5678 domain-containing protein [Caldilineaceae bacterium]